MTVCANCNHPAKHHDLHGCRVGRALVDANQDCRCPFEYNWITKVFNEKGSPVGDERPGNKECRSRYRKHTGAEVICIKEKGHDGAHAGYYNRGDQTPSTWQENESVATFEQGLTEPVANPDRVKAADGQAGGSHYLEMPIQPWEIIDAFSLGYYEGSILSYLLRAGRKGSKLEDLKKAGHFLEKLIELEEQEG